MTFFPELYSKYLDGVLKAAVSPKDRFLSSSRKGNTHVFSAGTWLILILLLFGLLQMHVGSDIGAATFLESPNNYVFMTN